MSTADESKRQLKYLQIYEDLREKIQSGELKQGSFLPPETILAQQMNVSTMTVVRALNELVKEHLIVRQRGVGTMVSNLKKAPLIPGKKLRLAIVWHITVRKQDLDLEFDGIMTQGVIKRCDMSDVMPYFPAKNGKDISRAIWNEPERGVCIEVVGEPWLEKNGHPPIDAIVKGNYDGIIAMGVENEEWIEQLIQLKIPTIIVDSPMEKFADRADFVFADPQLGYREAVEHFVSMGKKRLHFVGITRWRLPTGMMQADWNTWKETRERFDNPDCMLRLSAFRQAMDYCGLEVTDDQIHFCDHSNASKLALADKLVVLSNNERPDAIICDNVSIGEIILRKYQANGFPLDGASPTYHPMFSTFYPIFLDGYDMGSTAIDLLLWRIQRPSRSFLNVGVRMKFMEKRDGEPV